MTKFKKWNEMTDEEKEAFKKDLRRWGVRFGYFSLGVLTVYGVKKLGEKIDNVRYPNTALWTAVDSDGEPVMMGAPIDRKGNEIWKKGTHVLRFASVDNAKEVYQQGLDAVEKYAAQSASANFEKALEASIKNLEGGKG